MAHVRIGDMLVAAGFVTEAQVTQALASQKKSGRRLGRELVELGFVSELQMTQILSNQLSVPWVSLHHVEFSRELLNLLPAPLADQHGVIPIYKRDVKRAGTTLFIAMEDPTDADALDAVRKAVALPVKPMIAPASDVRNAIRVYYFGIAPRSSAERMASRIPPPDDDEAEIEIEELDMSESELLESEKPPPKKAVRKVPRFITFALLDGTTVKLPAGEEESTDDEPVGDLTASDLVSALVARAQGADVSDVLPDDRWEVLVATVLSLLIRKGLIADWEFVEAWKKNLGS